MRGKKWIAVGSLCMLLFSAQGTYAWYQSSVSVQNHIRTGDVNIGIQEYEEDAGREVLCSGTEGRTVLPSQRISKIPRITNYAEPCYVRVKVSGKSMDEDDIFGMPEAWIAAGGYYYWPEPLDTGASVDVFRAVTIPSWWTENASGQTVGLTVTAEAVQSAHFTPDFQSEDPWGGQKIELCVHEQDGAVQQVEKVYQSMSVVYEGAARNLVAVPEDFFSNLGTAMPGDTLGDSVSVRNTTETEAEFFFRTEVPAELTDEERDLMEQFSLEITQEGRLVYSGGLDGKELEGAWVSLGVYQPGEEGEIHFTLQLPSELKNVYAQRETFVNWMFSVQGEEPVTETGGPVIQQLAAPKTGLKDPAVSVPLLLAAISGISTWILCRREKCHGMEK